MLAKEPLLSWYFNLKFLFNDNFFHFVFCIEFFFPSHKCLRCNRGERGKFRSFEYFITLLDNKFIISNKSFSLNKIFMYPISSLFHYIVNDRFVVAVDNDIVNLLSDVIDIISGKPSDGLDLVFERGEWILFWVLKHNADLILKLIALVWFA